MEGGGGRSEGYDDDDECTGYVQEAAQDINTCVTPHL
jgi:hypothetical protein